MHLIITEKNITAKKIAQILFGKSTKETKIEGVSVYSSGDTSIVGLSGHIVNIDFPEQYNNWSVTAPKDLIRAETEMKYTHKKIATALKKLSKEATSVTIATDFDREGELIGVEAYRIISDYKPDMKFDRAKFSAITKPEIDRAFSNRVPLDFNLAAAGEARQKIDLVWGAALTRYISLTCGRLGKSFLSVGRVQTPLLALLVDREKEIKAFTSTPYWEIYATLGDSAEFIAKHECNRFEDKKKADTVRAKLGSTGTVAEYKKDARSDAPPIPFSTTEFIRAASSIGFSAANAMRIAENLYVNGWISYPRTDNTVYPSSLNLREVLQNFAAGEFGEYARKLLGMETLVPTRGKKETTDHPPIYPVTSAKKSDMAEDEWRVYELVVRRFFATLAPAATWETRNTTVDISGEKFKASGSKLTEAGWRYYYPYGMPKEEVLPALDVGTTLPVKKIEMPEKMTQPPTRYGQGRLVKMMEDLGLGTKSTRHEAIQKLYARNYVHGNPPQPTNTAIAVVDALERYADLITKPDMTSRLENDMDEIADGKIKEESVVDESQNMLQTIFGVLDKNHDEIREVLFDGLREDKILGKCQTCGSDLMIRKSKKGGRFIGCTGYPNCTFSLPLPPSGTIVATNKVCERHGLSHIKIMTGGKKPWELGCPQCNFEEWQKKKKEAAAAAGEASTGTATAPKKPATAKKPVAKKAEADKGEADKPVKKVAPKKAASKKKVIEKAPEA
ncbi:DNA topoisomerase I [Methanocella sp. MCL-LM]|uniref:DNA topoisomerase I n=1 Tax=Methanocella sp. MCL-LM TaxID=3412035 RepID=UPI003C770FEC